MAWLCCERLGVLQVVEMMNTHVIGSVSGNAGEATMQVELAAKHREQAPVLQQYLPSSGQKH